MKRIHSRQAVFVFLAICLILFSTLSWAARTSYVVKPLAEGQTNKPGDLALSPCGYVIGIPGQLGDSMQFSSNFLVWPGEENELFYRISQPGNPYLIPEPGSPGNTALITGGCDDDLEMALILEAQMSIPQGMTDSEARLKIIVNATQKAFIGANASNYGKTYDKAVQLGGITFVGKLTEGGFVVDLVMRSPPYDAYQRAYRTDRIWPYNPILEGIPSLNISQPHRVQIQEAASTPGYRYWPIVVYENSVAAQWKKLLKPSPPWPVLEGGIAVPPKK